MSAPRRNTTVDAAVGAVARHALVRADEGMVVCSCGARFPAVEGFTDHQTACVRGELAATKGRRPVTDELLVEVAEVFQAAPPRKRHAAVADLLGCSSQSASFYVYRARRAGLLDAPARAVRC